MDKVVNLLKTKDIQAYNDLLESKNGVQSGGQPFWPRDHGCA